MDQKMKRIYEKWTDDEVHVLLSVFAEDEIQKDFESATRNDRVYRKMEKKLADLNVRHTTKQIREKLKKLKQDYKKLKVHNSRSGSDRRTNKWYEQLDAVLGHKPAYSCTAAAKEEGNQWNEVPPEMDRTDLPSFSEAAPSGSSIIPSDASSPRSPSPAPYNRPGKRKRERDQDFLDALWQMEEAHQELLWSGMEQRERLLRQIADGQAEEMELRRQELAMLREEADTTRRQERDFQTGLLAVLDRLVQVLGQKP